MLAVSVSSSQIVPDVGSIIRLIIRSDVVLPQPDGPTSTVILPGRRLEDELVDGDGAVGVALGGVVEADHGVGSWLVGGRCPAGC